MDIFVGNLSFESVQDDVKKLFAAFGNVTSVTIVMRKEKKAPKSRGFGFVQMPNEQEALAAIAALSGKEFMGRLIDVSPARPKTETQAASGLKEKGQTEFKTQSQHYPRQEEGQRESGFNPVFNKQPVLNNWRTRPSGQAGRFKGGRRTHSYLKRQILSGAQEDTAPRRKSQDNPMRWRKKSYRAKPWQKGPGEQKTWKKAEKGIRAWDKPKGESMPWLKSEHGFKSWKKPAGEDKSWSKSSQQPQKLRFNPSTSSFDRLKARPERSRRPSSGTAMSQRREPNGRGRTKIRVKPG